MGHKTVTINHIKIVTNHSLYIITKSKRNTIVLKIEYEKQLQTTSIDNRAFILAKSNKSNPHQD